MGGTASGASLAVQRGVFAALSCDAGVTAAVTGVFDEAAPDAVEPYATIGADVVVDAGTKSGSGFEHRLTVSVWDASGGSARAKAAMAAIEAAIGAIGGVLPGGGWRAVSARVVRSLVVKDVAGCRGVIEVRVRSEAV